MKANIHPIHFFFKQKYFLPFLHFLAVTIAIGLFIVIDFKRYSQRTLDALLSNSKKIAQQQEKDITEHIQHTTKLLNSIAQTDALVQCIQNNQKSQLKDLFKSIIYAENSIMQIRLIDAAGMEQIRFERKESGGKIHETKKENLQDKSHRKYVSSNLNQPNRIWFSELNLNMEKGKIEVPFRPTYRAVLPVWSQQVFAGMIVVNYFAEPIFIHLTRNNEYKVMLVDADGYILFSTKEKESWSRFQDKPFTFDISYRDLLADEQTIYKQTLSIPLHFPFQNHLWLILQPSQEYLLLKKSHDEEYIFTVFVTLLSISFLISFFMFLILKKMNLRLENIQEKNRTNELLLEQQAKISSMEDALNQYVLTSNTDLDGVITHVSQAFCDVSGFSKEELIGHKHNLIRHPDTPIEVYQELWSCITGNRVWQGEIKTRPNREVSFGSGTISHRCTTSTIKK